MLLTILIIFFIPLALLMLSLIIQKRSRSEFVKIAPFECGFEEFSRARLSFSLKFFLIVLVFLIFDVEIALVLPMPLKIRRAALD